MWFKRTLKYVTSLWRSPDKNRISACHKKKAPNLTNSLQKISFGKTLNFENNKHRNMESSVYLVRAAGKRKSDDTLKVHSYLWRNCHFHHRSSSSRFSPSPVKWTGCQICLPPSLAIFHIVREIRGLAAIVPTINEAAQTGFREKS